jgi:hypothetical protein
MATKDDDAQTRKKPVLLKAWEKLGLDGQTVMKMIKFALPPTISLCICQSNTVANTYTTVGYLIAIGSILSSGLAPRATYIEATICNVFFVSMTALVSIFAMWTVLKARETTTAPASTYSSSASAVSGVWIFFLLYVINVCISNFIISNNISR